MHPRQHRRAVSYRSAHQGEVQDAADDVAVSDEAKRAKVRLHGFLVHALHGFLRLQAVADQVGNGADFQAVSGRKGLQIGAACHRAIFAHHLDQHGRRLQPGQAGQVAPCFGMSGTGEHAARLRGQRKYVTGLVQVLRLGRRLYRDLHRAGAIVRGNAGGDPHGRLDGHGEVGVLRRGILADHRPQAELMRALLGQREAQQTPCLAHHEVDILGAHLDGGHDQVALVLAPFIVQDHDHATGANVFENFGNGIEGHD